MLIFNNTQATGTFSITLRDKFTQTYSYLYLKLTKIDDLAATFFRLTNTSTSDRYKTYTIATDALEEGQYEAEIFEGYPADGDTCLIEVPTLIVIGTQYICDPLVLEDELALEDEAVITSVEIGDVEIYSGYARVEGDGYDLTYRNSSSPTYYTYDE